MSMTVAAAKEYPGMFDKDFDEFLYSSHNMQKIVNQQQVLMLHPSPKANLWKERKPVKPMAPSKEGFS